MTQPSRHFAAASNMSGSRVLIYGALLLWAFVCLFPIYWTISTSFKTAVNVTQGDIIPWVGRFQPDWKGWRSLGLSPDTIGQISTVRDEFLLRFRNSVLASVGAALLAVIIGSLAAYGLSRFQYRFGPGGTRTSRSSSCRSSSCRRSSWPCHFSCFTRSWRCSTASSGSS